MAQVTEIAAWGGLVVLVIYLAGWAVQRADARKGEHEDMIRRMMRGIPDWDEMP